MAEFSSSALITTNGEWYEKGEMGWFGMSSSNKESIATFRDLLKEKLKEADQEYFITMIDCHI